MGLGTLRAGVFWVLRRTHQEDWCWNAEAKLELFGAHHRTPKWGLSDARTNLLGDKEVVARGTNREAHPHPQAEPSLRPGACHTPGDAERAVGWGPNPESQACLCLGGSDPWPVLSSWVEEGWGLGQGGVGTERSRWA